LLLISKARATNSGGIPVRLDILDTSLFKEGGGGGGDGFLLFISKERATNSGLIPVRLDILDTSLFKEGGGAEINCLSDLLGAEDIKVGG
jgi:hypothetical protein